MTVYFDRRAEQQEPEENLEEEKQKEAVAVVVAIFFFFGKPLVIMLLWNWLMPGIFGLATIGYLKSLGLYFLARIIIDKND